MKQSRSAKENASPSSGRGCCWPTASGKRRKLSKSTANKHTKNTQTRTHIHTHIQLHSYRETKTEKREHSTSARLTSHGENTSRPHDGREVTKYSQPAEHQLSWAQRRRRHGLQQRRLRVTSAVVVFSLASLSHCGPWGYTVQRQLSF